MAQKTRTRLTIDLNSSAKRIIARFKNDPILKGFCTTSNYNGQLKKIGAKLGIDTPIREVYLSGTKEVERIRPKYARLTSHVGRRTFVVLCCQREYPLM